VASVLPSGDPAGDEPSGTTLVVRVPNPKDICVEETVTNVRAAVDAAGVVATGGQP
jgi:hypothetical protein